ncbi:MAG: response regulator [Flavobacteriales bacterium]|nr:response regulator [Flavobacteriales bacterium]
MKKLPLIFIVDDDTFFTELVRLKLEDKRYSRLETFSSGEECMAAVHRKPDIIFMDHEMSGGMNGTDTLIAVKKINKKIEVVFITGQDDPQVARNALKYGAYDYIVKNRYAMNRLTTLIPNLRKHMDSKTSRLDWENGKTWALGMAVCLVVFVTAMAQGFILDMLGG